MKNVQKNLASGHGLRRPHLILARWLPKICQAMRTFPSSRRSISELMLVKSSTFLLDFFYSPNIPRWASEDGALSMASDFVVSPKTHLELESSFHTLQAPSLYARQQHTYFVCTILCMSKAPIDKHHMNFVSYFCRHPPIKKQLMTTMWRIDLWQHPVYIVHKVRWINKRLCRTCLVRRLTRWIDKKK